MSKFLIGLAKVKRRLVLILFWPSIMQLVAFPQQDNVRDIMLPLSTAAAAGQAFVPLHIVAETSFEAPFR
jgi:hypothetical protein